MAEKEERILIEKRDSEGFPFCAACWTRNGKDYFCSWDGEDTPTNKERCEKKCPYDSSISRQEAIERMAKALHKESTRISNMEKDFDKLPAGWRESFYNYAEAALNALLEEK